MLKTVIIAGGTTAMLCAAAAMFSGPARAQGSPWCSGQASLVNGQLVASNFTPPGPGEPSTGRGAAGSDPTLSATGPGPGGIAETCEILATPAGFTVQNGGSTTDPRDGQNAQHEATGHGPDGQR